MTIQLNSADSVVSGQAQRIRAADKAPAVELQAQPATLTATIQITRAATGKVEEYTITGTPVSQGA